MPADAAKSNLYQDKENGLLKRVDSVGDTYVKITVLGALQSTFSLPTSDYDTKFLEMHNVVDAGDMRLPDDYRPPANAVVAVELDEPTGLDESRGETEEGVTIDAPSVPLGL